jgi:hypothetical protein
MGLFSRKQEPVKPVKAEPVKPEKPAKPAKKKDALDEYMERLGITEESAAAQREEASVGCQHVNMRTDGMSRWCEDCDLMDDA